MKRTVVGLIDRLKTCVLQVTAFFEKPWSRIKLNSEEIAERRRNRLEANEQNLLWCWQHRGFW